MTAPPDALTKACKQLEAHVLEYGQYTGPPLSVVLASSKGLAGLVEYVQQDATSGNSSEWRRNRAIAALKEFADG